MRPAARIVAGLALKTITLNAQSLADDLALLDVTGHPDPLRNARAVSAPPGAQISPGGRAASTYSYESDVRLETPLAITAIADHYTKQIINSRWKLEARRDDGAVLSAARFAGTNAASEPVTALLTVARLTPTRVAVAVRIFRREPVQKGLPPRPPDPANDRVVARALLPQGSSTEQRVFQDTAPASFPVDVFPAGAKVVVAAVGATRAGVVAAAPSFASTNFTRHIRRLTEAGWIDQRGALGGFSNPRAVNTRLCRGQQAIDIALYPREAGGSYLRVTTQPPEPCRTDRPSPFRDTAMPLLLPPPGVWSPGSGGGGGNDTRHFGSQLISREKLAPVTAHFVDQMTKSDWPIAGRVTDDLMSVSLHRSKTTSGDAITSVVSLTAVPEAGMIDAWLRIIRHN